MKKKISGGKIALIVILSIIAAIIIAVVCFGLIIKSRLDSYVVRADNISELVNAQPLSFEERVTFYEDGTMDFIVDKADIYWFLNHMYEGDFEAYISDALSENGLELQEMGFVITDEGFEADISAYWKSFRLAGTLFGDFRYSEGVIFAEPASVQIAGFTIPMEKIASIIRIPVGRMQISYEPDSSLISEITDVQIANENLVFSGPLDTSVVRGVNLNEGRVEVMSISQDSGNIVSTVLENLSEDPAVCYQRLLPELVKDPAYFYQYLQQLYPLITEYKATNIVDKQSNYGFSERWFTYISSEEQQKNASASYDEYYVAYRFIHEVMNIIAEYNDYGYFYDKSSFDPVSLFGDQYVYYSTALQLDTAFLVSVEMEGADDIGLVVHGKDEKEHLLYKSADGSVYNYDILSQEEYEELKNTGVKR